MSREPRAGEVYLEYRPVGAQVQVTAIDAATGVEVSVFGPVAASETDLKRLALRKLQRRLSQEKAARQPAASRDPTLY